MSAELALWAASGLGLASLGGLAGLALHRPHEPLTWRTLKFPEELPREVVSSWLRHVAAVREGPVCIEVRGEPGDACFRLGAPRRVVGSLLAAASGLVPELQAYDGQADPERKESRAVVAVRAGWRGPWPLLRQRDPELTAAALLGALAGVNRGERLRLLVRLWPVGRVSRPVPASERRPSNTSPWFMRPWWPAEPPREEVSVVRAKFSGLLLRTELLVAGHAAGSERAMQLVQRLVAALRSAGGSRGVLRYRRIGSANVAAVLSRQRAPLPWELTTVLSPEELVGIVGLPVGTPRLAGIRYGVAPALMAPNEVPRRGRVVAESNWPAQAGRTLAQPLLGALQHTAVVGPTGSGKSTLVGRLVEQDLAAGRGALVVDLKGDLVADLLSRIPARRMRDVVVLEPAREGSQPGLALFPRGGDPELTADLLLGTLRELFIESWGVRSSQYLGLGLRTLALLPGTTLLELPLLFANRRLRAKALGNNRDGWLAAAWERFDALTPADQAAQLSAPLAKLEELTARRRVRAVLGQTKPGLDFHEVLNRGQVVLVSLPPGLLGAPATRLLAALTLWQFFQAVEARAAKAPGERRPFMAYVDEVAVLASLPLPIEGLLERARSHGVGVTLAPQALSQLSPNVRASLLANAGTLIAFGQHSEEEAAGLARSLPAVTDRQLQRLGQYELVMRLALAPGHITSVMSGRTLPLGPVCSDPDEVRRLSAERYGQTVADVGPLVAAEEGAAPSPSLGVVRRRP